MTTEIKQWRSTPEASQCHTSWDAIALADREIAELRAALAASGGNAAPGLTDDALYNFWLYRDCMDAIRAGDMRAQVISAARAAIAASAPNAALVAITEDQLSRAARYISDRSAEECGVDKDDAWKIYGSAEIENLRAALSAAGQEVGK